MSALNVNKAIAIIGKQKDSVQRDMLAVSVTMGISVEKQRDRPLLLQNRRLKATGKFFGREVSQRP